MMEVKYEMEGILAHVQDLDVDELSKLGKAVRQAVESGKEKKEVEVRKKIAALAASIDTTPEKLFKKYRVERTVTHMDPLSEENIWRGRGRKPDWLVRYIAQGWDSDVFKIQCVWKKKDLDKLKKQNKVFTFNKE